MRRFTHADDREPRALRGPGPRTTVRRMRAVLLCGMSLVLVAGSATAASPGKSAVAFQRPQLTYKVGRFNWDTTSKSAPSPCLELTFKLTPRATVYHADVTQVADLPSELQARSPDVG